MTAFGSRGRVRAFFVASTWVPHQGSTKFRGVNLDGVTGQRAVFGHGIREVGSAPGGDCAAQRSAAGNQPDDLAPRPRARLHDIARAARRGPAGDGLGRHPPVRVRCSVLDETLRAKFQSWYPGLFHVRNADCTEHALAARPHGILCFLNAETTSAPASQRPPSTSAPASPVVTSPSIVTPSTSASKPPAATRPQAVNRGPPSSFACERWNEVPSSASRPVIDRVPSAPGRPSARRSRPKPSCAGSANAASPSAASAAPPSSGTQGHRAPARRAGASPALCELRKNQHPWGQSASPSSV